MASEVVKFTHEGVEVVYWERENVWKFTLRGRERRADNPRRAKEVIDKPVPADKAKPFERIKAIKINEWGVEFTFGEVTSIAEDSGSRMEVWFVNENGDRRKEQIGSFKADTDSNRAIVTEALRLKKEASLLTEAAKAHTRSMTALTITVPE